MKCWMCKSEDLTLVKESDLLTEASSDHFKVSDSNYGRTGNLHKCNNCQFLQCFDFVNSNSLYEDMTDNEYISSQSARAKEMNRILTYSKPFLVGANSIFDIGAGTGMLVQSALSLGYLAKGVEPSKHLSDVAVKQGLDVMQGVFPNDAFTEKFDVITLIDVIEHVNEPIKFLTSLHSNLSTNGYVVISTPDCSSILAKILKWKWWHYRIAHISYFDQNYLDDAMAKAGFKLIAKSRPSWYFDADYIFERLMKFLFKRDLKLPFLNRFQIRVNLHDSILCIYKVF